MKNMKKIYYVLLFSFLMAWAVADMPDSEYKTISENIAMFSKDNSEYAIDELIRYVHIAYKYREEGQQNRAKFYDESVNALKNKSQHIQHLKNKIEEYSQTERPGKEIRLNSYFAVLQQIKSVESVQLLGEFLYDKRNAKPNVEWEPGMDIAPNNSVSNSGAAAKALQSMGIKNPPQTDDRGYPIIESWKLWFEQVKAGTRTFSFEGENIAYRMKKDGTFETIAATAVAEKSQGIIEKKESIQTNSSATVSQKNTWIVFATLLVLLAALYFMKFRRSSG
jgi:hypothetical protein